MTKPGPLLMVIDDDDDIRDMLQLILESDGYRVSAVGAGYDALHCLQTNEPPALILLDLMMPEMDGEQFMKILRSSTFKDIPVILMTGNKAGSEKVIELKANGCLTKPVELDELLVIVREFVSNPGASADRPKRWSGPGPG